MWLVFLYENTTVLWIQYVEGKQLANLYHLYHLKFPEFQKNVEYKLTITLEFTFLNPFPPFQRSPVICDFSQTKTASHFLSLRFVTGWPKSR